MYPAAPYAALAAQSSSRTRVGLLPTRCFEDRTGGAEMINTAVAEAGSSPVTGAGQLTGGGAEVSGFFQRRPLNRAKSVSLVCSSA